MFSSYMLQLLAVKRRLYNVFGFGAGHGTDVQFLTQAPDLICGVGTRFPTWFYAIHRLLW